MLCRNISILGLLNPLKNDPGHIRKPSAPQYARGWPKPQLTHTWFSTEAVWICGMHGWTLFFVSSYNSFLIYLQTRYLERVEWWLAQYMKSTYGSLESQSLYCLGQHVNECSVGLLNTHELVNCFHQFREECWATIWQQVTGTPCWLMIYSTSNCTIVRAEWSEVGNTPGHFEGSQPTQLHTMYILWFWELNSNPIKWSFY